MFILVTTLIKFAVFILVFVLSLAALLTWMERRQSAYLQDRVGPTRADIKILGRRITAWGLVHIIADALKMFFKENFAPAAADKALYMFAPLIGFSTTLIVVALIPFGPDIVTADVPLIGGWLAQSFPEHPTIPMQIARLDAGILLVFAISSLGIYGASIAGWASNNRYALLGGLRAAAQGVSYEVALGLTTVGVLVAFGATELSRIVDGQNAVLFGGLPAWGIFVQPFAAILYLVAATAETKRAPFDLPECESEILGFSLEYSSMSFGLFMLTEFIEVTVLSALFVTLFLGGYELPWILGQNSLYLGFTSVELSSFGMAVAGLVVFGAKVFLIAALQLQVRWTLPRFRYDQLMRLSWKTLLPLALLNIFVTAVLVWLDPSLVLAGYVGVGLIVVFAAVVIAGPRKSASHDEHAAHGHAALDAGDALPAPAAPSKASLPAPAPSHPSPVPAAALAQGH